MNKLNKNYFILKGKSMIKNDFYKKWPFWTNVIGIICILGVILFVNQGNNSNHQNAISNSQSSHVSKKKPVKNSKKKVGKKKPKVQIQRMRHPP